MKILEVFNVDQVVSERTGRPYVRVSFRAATVDDKGNSMFSGLEKGTRIVFPGEEPNVGDRFAGSIITFPTSEYEIEGRTINKCKMVVFEGENGVELVNDLLESQGHNACALDSAGKLTKKLKKIITNQPADEDEEEVTVETKKGKK